MQRTYLCIVKINRTYRLILTVTPWMLSDENLAYARDGADACHLFLSLWHLCCWASKARLCLPPSHFISHCARGTCSLSMRSTASLFSPLTVTLQYFSIPITGTVGDPLFLSVLPATQVWLHVKEQSHYGHNYTLLLTWLCQPFLLIHDPLKRCRTYVYMRCHVLAMNVPALSGTGADEGQLDKKEYHFYFILFYFLKKEVGLSVGLWCNCGDTHVKAG